MPKTFEIESPDEDDTLRTYCYSTTQQSCAAQIKATHLLLSMGSGLVGPLLGDEMTEKQKLFAVVEELPRILASSAPEQYIGIMNFCAAQSTYLNGDKQKALDRSAWSEHFRGRLGDALIFAGEVIRYNLKNFGWQVMNITKKVPDSEQESSPSS